MKPEELRLFIIRHNLSRNGLADILGVSQQAVVNWLSGLREISEPIARVLRLFDKYPHLMEEFR